MIDSKKMASGCAALIREHGIIATGDKLWEHVRGSMDDVSYPLLKKMKAENPDSGHATDVWDAFGDMWRGVDKLALRILYTEDEPFSEKFGPLWLFTSTPGRTAGDVAALFEEYAES